MLSYDTQTHKQTDASEHITTPHVGGKHGCRNSLSTSSIVIIEHIRNLAAPPIILLQKAAVFARHAFAAKIADLLLRVFATRV